MSLPLSSKTPVVRKRRQTAIHQCLGDTGVLIDIVLAYLDNSFYRGQWLGNQFPTANLQCVALTTDGTQLLAAVASTGITDRIVGLDATSLALIDSSSMSSERDREVPALAASTEGWHFSATSVVALERRRYLFRCRDFSQHPSLAAVK